MLCDNKLHDPLAQVPTPRFLSDRLPLKHVIADLRETLRLPDLVSILGRFDPSVHGPAGIDSVDCLVSTVWFDVCGPKFRRRRRLRGLRIMPGAVGCCR